MQTTLYRRFEQERGLRFLFALLLAAGMIFAGSAKLLAQDVPPPPPDAQGQQPQPQDNNDNGQMLPQYGTPLPSDDSAQQQQQPPQQQGAPVQQGQPITANQLDQLVAPIALYPDSLVAQVLAASTYPTQLVEADQWRQAQGNASPDQIAAAANSQQWDASVKALTAFPSVLTQMHNNMQWTTDLGNAYYNQPQDVMDAVQRMRQRAQQAGTLQDTPQETVAQDNGSIEIQPASPDLVYVPVYDPWVAYGPPIIAWPGYYYAPPPAFFVGVGFGWGFRMGFAWGVPLRPWAPWGWGWHNWGVGWYNRTVVYNRTTYITRSTTVINRGFSRPGSPPMQLAGTRGSFMNRPQFTGYAHNVAMGARPAPAGNGFVNRPASVAQPGNHINPGGVNRPAAPVNGMVNGGRPTSSYSSGTGYSRPNFGGAPLQTPNYNRSAQTYRAPQAGFGNPGSTYRAPAAQNYHSAPTPHYSAPQQHYSAPAFHASAPSAPHYGGGGGGGGGSHHR
ncbi:MAG TPA: DUF3300 domain-containing protein [Pseudacidobacterium sp.]|jgi:hypothetical protein|nr:DUF3300 domain-containing protein [Pseudacidobacterium sp.]